MRYYYGANWNSIAVDKDGIPWVLYNLYDGTDVKDLQVKRFNGSSWERVGQIISGARTDGIDIAFDNNNVAHVSCREGENNAIMLKYNKSNGFWDLVGYSFAYRGAGTNIAFTIPPDLMALAKTPNSVPAKMSETIYCFSPKRISGLSQP